MLETIYKLFFSSSETTRNTSLTVRNFILVSQLFYHLLGLVIFGTLLREVNFPKNIYIIVLLLAYLGAYALVFRINKQNKTETAKYIFYIITNIFLFVFSSALGNKAGIYLLYFPLITSTLVIYGFHDKEKIILMTALSFAFLGLLDFTEHRLWLFPISAETQHSFYAANFILSVGVIGFCIIYLISVLYHTETRLRESESNLSSILASLNEVVWAATLPDGDILYINAAAEHVFAFSQPSFYENRNYWSHIVLPDDRSDYEAFEAEVHKKGSDEIEYRVVRKNGELRWLRDRCKIVWDEDGKPLRMEGITTDITEHKLAEEKVKQQNEQLRGILESTQSSIFALDTDYNYLIYNSTHKELMQKAYGAKVTKGVNVIEDHLLGLDTDKIINHLQQAFQGKQFMVVEELGEPNLHRTWYETVYNPIQNEFGKVTGVAVFSRDITERKRAENELIRTNFELDTFVYRASHDMRAPLRSVLGLVNLIKIETDEKQKTEYLKLIEKSVDRLDAFFSDILSFSRNSRLDIVKEQVDFNKLTKECWNSLQYLENASEIRLIKDIRVPEPFYSDSSRIEIILLNLFSNAIKYQKACAGARVRISIKADNRIAKIVVEDNGKGIEEQYIDKIFDMFFRASLGTHGSGLGLYITKQVVEKLGGSINVQSEHGVGTQFVITIPSYVPTPVEIMAPQN
ncbi:ATP-binding protein [Cytophagaceae bacterium YF14B1]|uniref:histidine kinase n=1 Tax=Xanthocytophaga flava TaxID=3048013 RepID=A0AAE3QT10_9BACT|nr:ATP-binding protein [Xanthocytophaga flavus]MDJ1484902.1 ATP-binding protein [Xanthocytophaga flavus]